MTMTRRFLTIEITSAGERRSPGWMQSKEHLPLLHGDHLLFLLSPLLPIVVQGNQEINKRKKKKVI